MLGGVGFHAIHTHHDFGKAVFRVAQAVFGKFAQGQGFAGFDVDSFHDGQQARIVALLAFEARIGFVRDIERGALVNESNADEGGFGLLELAA